MPKYDYQCENPDCNEVFEYTHPMSETFDMHLCATCGEGFLHKVFTPTPGIFRGQGWGKVYRTYKPKGS